jgi:hypothetical protein
MVSRAASSVVHALQDEYSCSGHAFQERIVARALLRDFETSAPLPAQHRHSFDTPMQQSRRDQIEHRVYSPATVEDRLAIIYNFLRRTEATERYVAGCVLTPLAA